MNLGAGRIVYQDLAKINLAAQRHFSQRTSFSRCFTYAKINNNKSTFLGLVSDGGVHPIPPICAD
jgi:2,3-bisphosphoglycerate-independent phosphoglycerate mutase